MTLESTPATYSSVNSPLVYVAYDAHAADPVTYPNYKYVGEVWIGGVKVFTAKVFPHPDTNRGIFDIAAIVREYIISTYVPTTSIDSWEMGAGEWSVDVIFKLREEYSGTVGAVVLTDSTRTFCNIYKTLANLSAFANAPVMTTRPANKIIQIPITASNYFLPIGVSGGDAIAMSIEPIGGGAVSVFNKSNANKKIDIYNISPLAIDADRPAAITSATTGYLILFAGGFSSLSSSLYTIELVCSGRYDNYILHFLNQFGGYESMLFNKQSKRSLTTEQKTYKQLPYRVSGAGVVSYSTGNVMHKQQSVFGKKFKRSLMVTTDIISDEEYTWLSQLICSPEVYCEIDGVHWPVTITDSNYEEKQYNTHKLTQLSINLDFGESFKTQFS